VSESVGFLNMIEARVKHLLRLKHCFNGICIVLLSTAIEYEKIAF